MENIGLPTEGQFINMCVCGGGGGARQTSSSPPTLTGAGAGPSGWTLCTSAGKNMRTEWI